VSKRIRSLLSAVASIATIGASGAAGAGDKPNIVSSVRSTGRRARLRRVSLLLLVALLACAGPAYVEAEVDALPSWNDGPAKQAILEFVRATTDRASPSFVPFEERIATFDQDGTLWVEQPMYAQVLYVLSRVPEVVRARPALAKQEPFKTVLSGDRAKIAKLGMPDLEKLLAATLTGMSVEEFQAQVQAWLASAKDHRWQRPYTELTYQPMLELLDFLRAHSFQTWIVTGGGQDFVRVYAEEIYGVPPEQVVGTAGATQYGYDANGKPQLTKEPKLLLNDDKAGKPEGIHLMIGRRPVVAVGNSQGDKEMLEYTKSGGAMRLAMILLHDDKEREYAYGPAQKLPASKIGTFPQALYDQAQKQGWIVISMKNDWNRIFAFQGEGEAAKEGE
jgi:phosphoserine phosphatase